MYSPPVKPTRIARRPKSGGTARAAVVFVLAGGGVFAVLAHGRAAYGAQASALPPLAAAIATAPPVPLPAAAPPVVAVAVPQGSPLAAPAAPPPVAAPMYNLPSTDAADRARARVAAPALIVDLAQARTGDIAPRAPVALSDSGAPVSLPTVASADYGPASTAAAIAGGAAATAPADPGARDINPDERFAVRAGNREVEVARAYRLPNQDTLVPQGTVVGAVMETALNSDVPGFARAVTTRDVLSFDGSQVMIPAGSHIVGEYKSGVAQGASRIFIVWTRLVRPDGVAIALASPATDDLGGGGLGGKVSRHFLERFGGAVLLSVLTGGLNAFTQSLAHGSTVVVSSSTQATSLAGEASRGTDIPPTIKTRQGATVRIFVARDLDFSGVGPVL